MLIIYFLVNFLSILYLQSLFASGQRSTLDEYFNWGSPIRNLGSPTQLLSPFSNKTSAGIFPPQMGRKTKGIAFCDDIFDENDENSDTNTTQDYTDSESDQSSDLTDAIISQSSSDSDKSNVINSAEPIRSIGGFGKFSTPQGHVIRQKLSEKDRHLLAALSGTFVQNLKKEESKSHQTSLDAYIEAGGSKEEFDKHVQSLTDSGIEELYITQSNQECFPTPLAHSILSRRDVQTFVTEGIAAPRADFLMPEILDEAPLDPKPILSIFLHTATREERSLYEIYATHLDAYKDDNTLIRITRHAIESLFLETIVTNNFRKLDIDIYHFFYCIDHIDIEKSLEALSFGNNPINKSGDVMHFHHVTQQEGKGAYMVLISGSIHQELHARIHFENTHKFRHQSVDRAAYTTNRARICEKLLEELTHVSSVSKIQEIPTTKPRRKLKAKKNRGSIRNNPTTRIVSPDHTSDEDSASQHPIKPVKTKRGENLDDALTTSSMPPRFKMFDFSKIRVN